MGRCHKDLCRVEEVCARLLVFFVAWLVFSCCDAVGGIYAAS